MYIISTHFLISNAISPQNEQCSLDKEIIPRLEQYRHRMILKHLKMLECSKALKTMLELVTKT